MQISDSVKDIRELERVLDKESEGFMKVSTMLEELEKDLPAKPIRQVKSEPPGHAQTVLEVLARAADDSNFLARLVENPAEVLSGYDLTSEERVALASGDLRRIESWVGKLDKRHATWLWCRLNQEKW